MEQGRKETIQYSVFNPTGNITALVESAVPVSQQPRIAAEIMRLHPAVAQVGFVRFPLPPADDFLPELRMAGGEFCGNASMCAAALYADTLRQAGYVGSSAVSLRVSGAAFPVQVCLTEEAPERWTAGVKLPPAKSVTVPELEWEGRRARVPLIRMEGIAHLILEPGSPFFELCDKREAASQAIRAWCVTCDAPCLGIMFLEDSGGELRLTPLVFVPGSDTLFWENSCASGSAAAGMLLAKRSGSAVSVILKEPGGVLRVESEPAGETWLYGKTEIIGQYTL